jgi:hypothetical protein
MSGGKSLPVNCAGSKTEQRERLLAKIGVDSRHQPVMYLWCRLHRIDHACRLEQMLQTWRELIKGDESAIQAQILRLKKGIRDLESDLEDLRESKVVG